MSGADPGAAIEEFREAIHRAGLTPPESIDPDGKLHRFASNGKRGDDAGWFVLHLDGIPAGCFGDWRTGFSQTWRADIGRDLTPAELAAHQARVDAARRAREAEEARRRAKAAREAAAIWKAAPPAPGDHPYLICKRIKTHGARLYRGDMMIRGVPKDGCLIIPVRDVNRVIHSLQLIAEDGTKRFLPDGRVHGCFYWIGSPRGTICICEGLASAATIRQATGHAVAVAFFAQNLKPVALALRMRFPKAKIILCADNDRFTMGNPGVTKAREAALAVHGHLAVPRFDDVGPYDYYREGDANGQ